MRKTQDINGAMVTPEMLDYIKQLQEQGDDKIKRIQDTITTSIETMIEMADFGNWANENVQHALAELVDLKKELEIFKVKGGVPC